MPVPAARPRIMPLIAVADLPRSVAFYTDGLGATVVTQLDHYALVELDGSLLHLAIEGPAPPDRADVALAAPMGRSRPHLIVIDVADCVRTADDLARLGARRLGEATIPPWGGERRCFVLDPDGHVLELNERLPTPISG